MSSLKENSVLNWNDIYKKYYYQVKSICGKILGYDHAYLNDTISETFEIGINKEHQYNSELSSVNTWLCQIAKNLSLKIKETDKRRTTIEDKDFVQENTEIDDTSLMAKQLMEIINDMPNSRPKEVFMKYFNGMNYAELAKEYNRKEVSMRTLVKRFLDKVRSKTLNDVRFKSVKTKCVHFPKVKEKTQMPQYQIEPGIYQKNKSFYVVMTVDHKTKYIGVRKTLEAAKELKQRVLNERG